MDKPKILIVEDEAIIAEDIQYCIEDTAQYLSEVANSGTKALEIVPEYQPDLILMDIMLTEELDGIETAQRIREQYDIPIVYLTSYTSRQMLERAKMTAPFGYIVKPFKSRELFATIEMAIYKHQIEQKLQQNYRLSSLTLAGGIALHWEDCQDKLFRLVETVSDQLPQEFRQEFSSLFEETEVLCQHLKMQALVGKLSKRQFSLEAILSFCGKIFTRMYPTYTLTEDYEKNLGTVALDVAQLDQLFLELLESLRQVDPAGEVISVTARNIIVDQGHPVREEIPEGKYIWITLENRPDEKKQHLDTPLPPSSETLNKQITDIQEILKKHGGMLLSHAPSSQKIQFHLYLKAL